MAWPGTGTAAIWRRLRRPFDPILTFHALLGLPLPAIRQLVGVVLANAEETEDLLTVMPHLVRSLTVSTTMKPTRCIGEVRGPVLWSETHAARAASAGAGGVFVCASPVKAFDTEENRVLVAALRAIRFAADDAEAAGPYEYDDPGRVRARHNGARAVRFLEHRTLVDVTRTRPDGRAVRRARAGTRRTMYQPSVAMLRRAQEPLRLADVLANCETRTAAQHDVLEALAFGMTARGVPIPRFMPEGGDLIAGPVRYRHARRAAERGEVSGILVGPLVIDVPDRLGDANPFRAQADLTARADGRHTYLVQSGDDLPRAVELALRATGLPPEVNS
jgi:hypothetical protein